MIQKSPVGLFAFLGLLNFKFDYISLDLLKTNQISVLLINDFYLIYTVYFQPMLMFHIFFIHFKLAIL